MERETRESMETKGRGPELVPWGEENGVPECVRTSDFGCPNCLWSDVECIRGSKYRQGISKKDGGPFCVAYAYCD